MPRAAAPGRAQVRPDCRRGLLRCRGSEDGVLDPAEDAHGVLPVDLLETRFSTAVCGARGIEGTRSRRNLPKMRPSEAFEQSLQCLSVRRSAGRFLRGCRADRRLGRRRDRASYLGAGQWQGVGVHVLPDLALRGTASREHLRVRRADDRRACTGRRPLGDRAITSPEVRRAKVLSSERDLRSHPAQAPARDRLGQRTC